MRGEGPTPEETIRAFTEDFNAERWDRIGRHLDPAVEVRRVPPEPEVRGRDAVVEEYLKPAMFSSQRIELRRIERVGDAWLTTGSFHGRGAGSGIELTQEDAYAVWRFRDGRVARFEAYIDRDEALAAARGG